MNVGGTAPLSEQVLHIERLARAAGMEPALFFSLARVAAEQALVWRARPSREQLARWRADLNGRAKFAKHVHAATGECLSQDCLDRLWRTYQSRPYVRSQPLTASLLADMPERLQCALCSDSAGPFHVDHRIPIAKGGSNRLTNLQILCASCNRKKSAKTDPGSLMIEFL